MFLNSFSFSAVTFVCFSYPFLRVLSFFPEHFFSAIFCSVTAAAIAFFFFFFFPFLRAIINNKLMEMGMFHLFLLMKSFHASKCHTVKLEWAHHQHMEHTWIHQQKRKYLSFICSRNTFIALQTEKLCSRSSSSKKRWVQLKAREGKNRKRWRKTKLNTLWLLLNLSLWKFVNL